MSLKTVETTRSVLLKWTTKLKLTKDEEWLKYATDVLRMVRALQLESCMELAGKSILDWKDPKSLKPKKVVEMNEEKWNSLMAEHEAKLPGDDEEAKRVSVKVHRQLRTILHSTLALTVGKKHQHLTSGREDPVYLWARLRVGIEGPRLFLRMKLQKKLNRQTLDDYKGDFGKLAAAIEETADTLTGLGKTIDEEDRIVSLMMALPEEEYGPTLENIAQHPTTFQAAVTTITNVVARKATNNYGAASHDDFAATAKEVHNGVLNIKRMSKKDLASLRTNIDRALAMKSGKAWRPGTRQPTTQKSFKYKCYGCGKRGHMKRDCPHRHNDNAAGLEDGDDSDFCWSHVADEVEKNSTAGHLVLDSGCTRSRMKSMGFGDVEVPLRNGNVLKLTNVAHCPGAAANYVAQRRLRDDGYRLKFVGESDDILITKNGKNICKTSGTKSRLFLIPIAKQDDNGAWFEERGQGKSLWKWHLSLGHAPSRVIKKLEKLKAVKGLVISNLKEHPKVCECCETSKMKKQRMSSKKPAEFKTKIPMERWHGDVIGKFITTPQGSYAVIMADEATGYLMGKALKGKKFFEVFKTNLERLENETGKRLKRFIYDDGKEVLDAEMRNYCKNKGIEIVQAAPRAPQQNGFIERRVQTVMRMTRAVLKGSNLGTKFWPWALKFAIYTLNRMPGRDKKKTPYELIFKEKPSIAHLHPFGCIGFRMKNPMNVTKGGFGDKAERCRFIGYVGKQTKTFVVLKENGRIVKEAHVRFYDTIFDFKNLRPKERKKESTSHDHDDENHTVPHPSLIISDAKADDGEGENVEAEDVGRAPDVEPEAQSQNSAENASDDDDDEDDPAPRRSTRVRTQRQVYDGRGGSEVPSAKGNVEVAAAMEDCLFGIDDGTAPKNWDEAKLDPAWVKATEEEISALEKNNTWRIIPRRPGRKKARVVAKGYTQYGVSFKDRYAPTLRIASLRAVLALAQVKKRKALSADINNAYLHGPENNEIYMEIPESLRDKYDPDEWVTELLKSLYGTKTAGNNWNKCIDAYMRAHGYKRCRSDPSTRKGRLQVLQRP
mmetsp:Transcript_10877/g.21521  ORF Transcript_10877/g.21521 Transcript_10877/m.21521 type:complete len:1057 (-) Transcript_10877:2144-5314(-)